MFEKSSPPTLYGQYIGRIDTPVKVLPNPSHAAADDKNSRKGRS